MRVQVDLTGRSPMLCHNARLSDPLDPIVKQIKVVAAKRKKTDEDYQTIARLEFLGGLYFAPEDLGVTGPVVPTQNIHKCIVEAAKVSRLGKSVTRALIFEDQYVPIAYEGPKNPEKMWEDGRFTHRASVGNQRNRVMRTRPKFPRWAVSATAHLLSDLLDFDDLVRIVELAGTIEGLGDNRTHGYGRFAASVTQH